MAAESELDKYEKFIRIDKNYSQILLACNETDKALEKAIKLIEESGVGILKVEILSPVENPSKFVLIQLKTEDMRDIVLRLTEEGFTGIKGYNATK